jgi:hypothetical protein
MEGIKFINDESGNKTAVIIDLKEHAGIWEDFYDGLVSESRKNEPTVSWEIYRK